MINDVPFYGVCKDCVAEGRLIVKGEGKDKQVYYQCFECNQKDYSKERIRRYHSQPELISDKSLAFNTPREHEFWTKDEADYQRAIIKHHLRPLFYGRAPETKELQRAADKLSGVVQYGKLQVIDVDKDTIPF
jgi:hypothetical protein